MNKRPSQQHQAFGSLLRAYRLQRRMSGAQLAKSSGMFASVICQMEKGSRPCGFALAVKLSQVLELEGEELHRFLLTAANTTTTPLLGAVLATLLKKGMGEDEVVEVTSARSSQEQGKENWDFECKTRWAKIYSIRMEAKIVK